MTTQLDAATVTVNPSQAVITDSLGETFSTFGVRVTVDLPWAPQAAPRPRGAPGSLKSAGRPIVFVFPHSIDRAQLRRGLWRSQRCSSRKRRDRRRSCG